MTLLLQKFVVLPVALVFTIVGFAATFTFAYAGSTHDQKHDYDEVTELEAEPYKDIAHKWEVEVEFDDHAKYTFYLYEISNEDELVKEIRDILEDEYNFEMTDGEVADILQYDEWDEDEDEMDGEFEIEAKPYKNIDGKWKVEVEWEGGDNEVFYVYNIDNEDDLVDAIAKELDLDWDEVEKALEVDSDKWKHDDKDMWQNDHDTNDWNDHDTWENKDEKNGEKDELSDKDRDDLIQILLFLIISMLMSGAGDDLDIDWSNFL